LVSRLQLVGVKRRCFFAFGPLLEVPAGYPGGPGGETQE
jgi:hypothetical protein